MKRTAVQLVFACALLAAPLTVVLLLPDRGSPQGDTAEPREVVLIIRAQELLAFSAIGDRWVSQDLLTGEQVESRRTASHVALVVTNVRVLGFSADRNRWDQLRLEPGERVLVDAAQGRVASVQTNVRALGFGARRGEWVATRWRRGT